MAMTARDALGKAPSVRPHRANFGGAAKDYMTLVNITNMSVQARGRGYLLNFHPGVLENSGNNGDCIQFVWRPAGMKMLERRKGALRPMNFVEGKRLYKRAKELEAAGQQHAAFAAIAEARPAWTITTEVEKSHKNNEIQILRAKYKKITGEEANHLWDLERLKESTANAIQAFSPDEYVDDTEEGVMDALDMLPRAPRLPENRPEPMSREDEVRPIQAVQQEVLGSDSAEKSRILVELRRRGRPSSGKASLATLQRKLAEAVAEQGG